MPVTMSGIRSSSAIYVQQGGTGRTTLQSGSLLVGNNAGNVGLIAPGSEGQVLTVVSGVWTPAESAAGGGGGGGLSSITTSGNLQGSGTAGSPATLKANISLTSVTASFSGNGSAITNLTASQIGGLNAAVDARITNIPNASLQNSSITVNGQSVSLGGSVSISTGSATISGVTAGTNLNGGGTSGVVTLNVSDDPTFTSITAETGTVSGDLTIQGNLYVNGSQTVVNTTDLTITDNVILIASGAVNAAQLDGAGIHFGRLPSEDARIIYDSQNDWMEIYPGISSSVIRGAFSGSGADLSGIPNSALQNSSITINGESVSLGGTVNIVTAGGGGFSTDYSLMNFTGSNFAVGDVVAMSGSLIKADYSGDMSSNVIGAVSEISGNIVTVKLYGEATALSASAIAGMGTPVYLGASGSVIQYSAISAGKYITQVGFISPNSGKVVLQPRVFGIKA